MILRSNPNTLANMLCNCFSTLLDQSSGSSYTSFVGLNKQPNNGSESALSVSVGGSSDAHNVMGGLRVRLLPAGLLLQ